MPPLSDYTRGLFHTAFIPGTSLSFFRGRTIRPATAPFTSPSAPNIATTHRLRASQNGKPPSEQDPNPLGSSQNGQPLSEQDQNRIFASQNDQPLSEQDSDTSLDTTKSGVSSNEYFDRLRKVTEAELALTNPLGLKKSYEIVQFDEDGFGPRDRFVYVEERDCIGCTHCATTAMGTFFMENENGRARVFDQLGDSEAAVEQAIDTCPVNCIYYVDWKDLVTLEKMRDYQEINNWARLVGATDFRSTMTDSKQKTSLDSGIMRCESCPKRGCAACPLYGVGENPEYLRLKSAREERKKKGKGIGGDGKKKTRRRL